MGIAEQIKSKLKQTSSGVPVGGLIASGETEIGFQQVSELLHYPGVYYVGPLPADIQQTTVFSAGVHSEAEGAGRRKCFGQIPERAGRHACD